MSAEVVDITTGETMAADVAALVVPVQVTVPATIEDAATVLEGVGGLLTAGHWGTAAVIYAFVEEPGQGARTDLTSKKVSKLTPEEFAAKGIRGLTSAPTVRKYRRAWEHAMAEGWAEPATPGRLVLLPGQSFTTGPDDPHVKNNSGDNEWYTPPAYIRAATEVLGAIDLDPASSAEANEIVGAQRIYTQGDDGLSQPWQGRVWMNPPYAQPLIEHFCEKLVEEFSAGHVPEACVLVNNATETRWFQDMAREAAAICFPKGRVRFWQPGSEEPGAPLQGQAVLYFGGNPAGFLRHFAEFGVVVVG